MAPVVQVTQCAAVTSRSPCGLWITLAVPKWVPSLPPASVNSAPTAGVPPKGFPLRDAEDPSPTTCASRATRVPVPPLAGVAKTIAIMASTVVPTTRTERRPSHRNLENLRFSGRIASLSAAPGARARPRA